MNQHLANIRLENLLAPKWSIILNDHGCQLQVFWGSPKSNQIPVENGGMASLPAVNPAQVKLPAQLHSVNAGPIDGPATKKARSEGPSMSVSHPGAGLHNIRQPVAPPMLTQQEMRKLVSMPGLFPPTKIRVKNGSPTAPNMLQGSHHSPEAKEENNAPLNLKTEPKSEIKVNNKRYHCPLIPYQN